MKVRAHGVRAVDVDAASQLLHLQIVDVAHVAGAVCMVRADARLTSRLMLLLVLAR